MGVKNLSRQRVALDMGSRVEVSVAEPLNDVISGIRSPDVVGRIDHLKQSPAEDFVPVKTAGADGLSIAVRNRCRQGEDDRLMAVKLRRIKNRSPRSLPRIRFVKTEVVEILDLKGLEIGVWSVGTQVVMHQDGCHRHIESCLI